MSFTDLVRTISYFSDLPTEEIQRLAQSARLASLEAGEVLFQEGDPAAGLYFLRQGRVKIVRYSPEGRELIIRQFGRGETFNEVGALDGTDNAATAIAERSGTEVILVPGESIRELVARDPHVGQRMMQEMASKLRFAMSKLNSLALMDVKQRLAAHLLRTVGDDGMLTGISHEALASQLGTVRQVLSRALGDLQRIGAVEVRRGAIRIIDRYLLKDQIPETKP